MALDGWTAQGVAELTVRRPNNSAPKTIYYGHDDTGGSFTKDSDGLVLQHQQWVTLTASMWPAAEPPTEAPITGSATGSTLLSGWRGGGDTASGRLPLLAAVFCGAAVVVCLVFAVIIYRCCVMNRKDKPYCTRKVDVAPASTVTSIPPVSTTPVPSTNGHPQHYPHYYQHYYQQQQQALPPGHAATAVYAVVPRKGADPVGSWGYTNRLLTTSTVTDGAASGAWIQRADGSVVPVQCTQCPGLCPSPVPRSSSVPGGGGGGASPRTNAEANSTRRQRPVSQPITVVVTNGDDSYKKPVPMPEISEFSPPSIQYVSSSILDEVGTREDSPGTSSLKTRSLPAWVRSKPRPLSNEDDLNDLYAKVNFSKKRKNRMRNDEAAIIALSKSRSQFLHKDTDSLVDNEAVIVYDERTAL